LATEATDAPQVFARKATGLRREASARDVFIYNTNNQNIGIGVAFVVLLVAPFYVGASMVVATILAGLLALPMACVYAYFAAAMPRSGGDYIYISRTLHPYLGFISSWNWMVWLVTYTGIPAAYLAQYGLSGLCREAGFALSSPRLVSYGDNFTRKWWIFAAGTILLTLFAIVFALGALLREHRIRSSHGGATDPVFATATGRPMYYRNVTRRGLTAAITKAGLAREGEPRLRFHDLRHTYASLLIAQGLNVVFISRQLGHASPSMTLDVYGGLFDRAEHARRASDGLEAAFSSVLAR